MQIRISVNVAHTLGQLQQWEERQIPFAVSKALNRTANAAQAAQREHMKRVFKLRHESFVLRGVKIAKQDRATKSTWRVVIQLAYPESRSFLDEHEQGQTRVRHGGKRLWQPNKDVFKSKIIGRANPLHPKNLKLQRDSSGRIIGQQSTFLVKSHGRVLVLQRIERGLTARSKRAIKAMTLDNVATGFGPHTKKQKALHRTAGTRLLYRLVDRVKIPARLEFVTTLRREAERVWPLAFNDELAKAVRSAR